MIYFESRYLSEKLGIPLAKWKRWSREFLAPDPLGGLRSGYARQFSYHDAFRVYLGGHLVNDLKFGIPEARQILSAIHPWLKQYGYLSLPKPMSPPASVDDRIHIFRFSHGDFGFEMRRYDSEGRSTAEGTVEEVYGRSRINVEDDSGGDHSATHAWVIYIQRLHRAFLDRLTS